EEPRRCDEIRGVAVEEVVGAADAQIALRVEEPVERVTYADEPAEEPFVARDDEVLIGERLIVAVARRLKRPQRPRRAPRLVRVEQVRLGERDVAVGGDREHERMVPEQVARRDVERAVELVPRDPEKTERRL